MTGAPKQEPTPAPTEPANEADAAAPANTPAPLPPSIAGNTLPPANATPTRAKAPRRQPTLHPNN
ncbi:MAG: hypothetical protein KC420_10130, partial [Myxococcales bacterium]|nr:hypothetical protein [Myxococcales bacterium]